MQISNQINIVISPDTLKGYLGYVEQIPQVRATGDTLAEANYNLLEMLKQYELDNYTTYSIVEYKCKTSILN